MTGMLAASANRGTWQPAKRLELNNCQSVMKNVDINSDNTYAMKLSRSLSSALF